jgi:uncharacterized membrane protein YfcA
MYYALFLLISLAATSIGAITGIGGGILIKPLLDAISGMDVAPVSFLSGTTVLAMSVVSLLRSRQGEIRVDIKKTSFLAIGASAGGVLGNAIFHYTISLSTHISLTGAVQSAILILLATGAFFYTLKKEKIQTHTLSNIFVCLLIGLLLGGSSSFLGIGGGPINIIILSYFFSMDSKTAALNSIYIIFFSQSTHLVTTIVTRTVPVFSPYVLLFMIAGGAIGSLIGSVISKKLKNRSVDLLFCLFLLIIIGISVYNFINFMNMPT